MLTIKTRLIILVCFMSAILIGVGTYGWVSLQNALKGQETIYSGGVDTISELHEIAYNVQNILSTIVKVQLNTITEEQGEKLIRNQEAGFNKNLEHYKKLLAAMGESRRFDPIVPKILNFQSALSKLYPILGSKDREKLTQFLKEEPPLSFDPLRQQMNQMVKSYFEESTSEYKDEMEKASLSVKISFFLMLFGIIASIIIAAIIIRNISRALKYTINVVDKLAEGDTSVHIETTSKDEIEKLLNAMRNMIGTTNTIINALKSVAGGDLTAQVTPRSEKDTLGHTVQEMIVKLRQMISKIQSEIKTVVGSSQEIVSSVTQVSSNTAETAAAVTETTTTTEELKQTAHVASEKAQGVLESAEETLKIVKSSEQSLGSTITDMTQIQEKMRIISESIIKLSENSQAIGEIIDTVNDLAEQSNLLAVNAAIEAARAGEQGKSFGVVAQEIRNLAEQSKSATIQVKSILNDIQNATSAAVMATEQGSKAVAKGVDQSSETSESIKNLCASIANVAQAAKQIALSSQQQLIGIDQVTVAMSNINDASNQHVEHMKQIETSVLALNNVGGSLKEIADKYQMVK